MFMRLIRCSYRHYRRRMIAIIVPASICLWCFPTTASAQNYTKLVPESPTNGPAAFGFSLSSSDELVVVGAPDDSEIESFAGAAYIFSEDEGEFRQLAKLIASDATAGDFFGQSVDVAEGDETLVVTGSVHNGERGVLSGAAYVFELKRREWIQTAKLFGSGQNEFDRAGWSVAASENLIAVGAVRADAPFGVFPPFPGAVWIFERDKAGIWTESQKIQELDVDGAFGVSIDIDDDYMLIGAPGSTCPVCPFRTFASIYFNRERDSGWSRTARFEGSPGSNFGRSVSLDGKHALIGAPFENALQGAAYIYRRQGNDWELESRLSLPGPSFVFGFAVDISDRVALVADGGVDLAGAVHVFEKKGSGWQQTATIIASDGMPNDRLGFAVRIMDEDSFLAGAYLDDEIGSVYVFGGEDSTEDFAKRAARSTTAGSTPTERLDRVKDYISKVKFDRDEPPAAFQAHSLPQNYSLAGVYPNPFNPSTTIRFAVPEDSRAQLGVYNVIGQEVTRLVDGAVPAGYHETTFQADDLPSGLYFVRLSTPVGSFVQKMMLVK